MTSSTVDPQAERRVVTLRELHDILPSTAATGSREGAIVFMAIRYGHAIALENDPRIDWRMATRARDRRFAALQRLVYGGVR